MTKRQILFIGLIIIIETLIFGLWINGNQPDPSVSIMLVLIVPFLFGLNIIIGLVFYFLKKREVSKIIFVNSIIAPLIFYLLWTNWYSGWKERNYSVYEFSLGQNRFEISISKTNEYFSISDITNKNNGSTTGLFFGEYKIKGDSILMTDEQTRMLIINDKLFGLPQNPTEIDLRKTTE